MTWLTFTVTIGTDLHRKGIRALCITGERSDVPGWKLLGEVLQKDCFSNEHQIMRNCQHFDEKRCKLCSCILSQATKTTRKWPAVYCSVALCNFFKSNQN